MDGVSAGSRLQELRCNQASCKFGIWDPKDARKGSGAETGPLESSRLVTPKGEPKTFNNEHSQGSPETGSLRSKVLNSKACCLSHNQVLPTVLGITVSILS